MKKLALIVAMGNNRVIGKDGKIPWYSPQDLRYFRGKTTGHSVIMGRKTHESIGRALPNRRNIVLSTQDIELDGCEVFGDLATALVSARETDDMPFAIGGQRVYEEALPFATDVFLTKIDVDVDGDVFFPELGEDWFLASTMNMFESQGWIMFQHWKRGQ